MAAPAIATCILLGSVATVQVAIADTVKLSCDVEYFSDVTLTSPGPPGSNPPARSNERIIVTIDTFPSASGQRYRTITASGKEAFFTMGAELGRSTPSAPFYGVDGSDPGKWAIIRLATKDSSSLTEEVEIDRHTGDINYSLVIDASNHFISQTRVHGTCEKIDLSRRKF